MAPLTACLNILYLPEKFPLSSLTSAYFHIRKLCLCKNMKLSTNDNNNTRMFHSPYVSRAVFLILLTCDFLFIFAQICYILISIPSLKVFHYIENNYTSTLDFRIYENIYRYNTPCGTFFVKDNLTDLDFLFQFLKSIHVY